MTQSQRVLIAESDDRTRTRLRDALLDAGVPVDSVADGREAIERLGERPYSMMIVDIALPIVDGIGVIERVRKFARSERPMLLATARRGPLPVLDADLVQMVLRKPLDVRHVAELVASCLRVKGQMTTSRASQARENDSSFTSR